MKAIEKRDHLDFLPLFTTLFLESAAHAFRFFATSPEQRSCYVLAPEEKKERKRTSI